MIKTGVSIIVLAVLLGGGCKKEQPSSPIVMATADYIIYRNDAGEVCAQSGRDGALLVRGKSASSVIQKAIDNLPVEGGKVYIAAGCYWLDSTIKIEDKHGVCIEGAARGIVFSGGKEGTVLRSTLLIDLIEIFGNKLKVAGITMSNLHLIGSGNGNRKSGIVVRGNSDLLTLSNVGVNHCGIGIYLKGGDGNPPGVIDFPHIQFCDPQVNGIGMKIERCHYGQIVGGGVADCDTYGIVITSAETGHAQNQSIKISDITCIRNGQAGILIGKNTEDISVTGCDIGGMHLGSGVVVSDEGSGQKPRNVIINGIHSYNNKDAGILVENAKHVVIQGCISSSHEHVAVENSGQEYGIHIKAGSENVLVHGNLTHGNKGQAILDDTGKAVIANNSDGVGN